MKKPRKAITKRNGGHLPVRTNILEREALFSTRRLLARHMQEATRLRDTNAELWCYNAVRISALAKAVELIKGTPRR